MVPALYTTHLDSANVYVHFEGAPDIQALAVYLSYSFEGDSTTTLVSATPDNQSGWAQQQSAAASFLGDSTYNWAIHFSTGEEKTKIKYAVETHLHPDTLSGSVWIQSALAQDSNGEVDTIRVVGAAVMYGSDLPAFSVPTDSLPGMAIVTFAPGAIAAGTRMVFPEDIQTASLRDSLVAMTGYSVGQHVFPSALAGEVVRVGVNGDTVSLRGDSSRSHRLPSWLD